MNEVTRSFARSSGCALVELEGKIPEGFFLDGCHLGTSGNAVVARAFAEALQ
jgi:hypothetical protein